MSLKELAKNLRKNSTDAERKLWHHLRKKQLNGNKFRRQVVIASYIVDFFCFEKKLVVEVDGGQHQEQISYDLERDKCLNGCGYTVLRFWNNEVLNNIESVLWKIEKELNNNEKNNAKNLNPK